MQNQFRDLGLTLLIDDLPRQGAILGRDLIVRQRLSDRSRHSPEAFEMGSIRQRDVEPGVALTLAACVKRGVMPGGDPGDKFPDIVLRNALR
jgi:hypothetical protein